MRSIRPRFVFLAAAILALLPAHVLLAADPTPQEYREDEFAPWMRDLRRGEIIMFGSLPFSLFFVTLGYDGVRYLLHATDIDASRYAPWPFRSANPVPYETEETVGVAVGVLAVSVAVAVVDYVIGRARERRTTSR